MRPMFVRRSVLSFCIASAALLAVASPSRAETMQFKADLKGANQVPPSQTPGIGIVTATYDSDTKRLLWKGSYSGLSGPPTAAHIHGPAAVGTNARLVFWISDNIGRWFHSRMERMAGKVLPKQSYSGSFLSGAW